MQKCGCVVTGSRATLRRWCLKERKRSTRFIRTVKINGGLAELADAPDLGSGEQSWGFEALIPYPDKKCRVVEIGRRDSFKNYCPKKRVGS